MWGVQSYPSRRERSQGFREVCRMDPVALSPSGCAPGFLGAWHSMAPRSWQLVTRSCARAQG